MESIKRRRAAERRRRNLLQAVQDRFSQRAESQRGVPLPKVVRRRKRR
jgi:hypothetical protein